MATPRAHVATPKSSVAKPHASFDARVQIGRDGGKNTQLSTHTRFSVGPIKTAAASHARAANQTGPPAATRPGHLMPHGYVSPSGMISTLGIQITRRAPIRGIIDRLL